LREWTCYDQLTHHYVDIRLPIENFANKVVGQCLFTQWD
jgi:hypothetical protein